MTVPPPADPGATPTAARALAPDLARGLMLLLIALANVHVYVYGHPTAVRGYPLDLEGADRWVVLLQMLLVDGRAYPLFGLLFGYGIVQLAARRGAVGMPLPAVTRLVRRRGAWMIVIGAAHGLLLWAGDIVGAYGLLGVLMAGLLVRGTERPLIATAAVGALLSALLYSVASLPAPPSKGMDATLPSMAVENPFEAALYRAFEWVGIGVVAAGLMVFGAVALGAWAGWRRLLDEPERHRMLLVRVAVAGIGAAVVLGLPLSLMAAQLWTAPSMGVIMLAGALHALGGYAGGMGYAALFGLLAIRLARRGRTGPAAYAILACGQRSLSCYLAQSVAFVALLPAWTFGLGDGAHAWQTALYAVATWLVILMVAAVSARAGYRGPAELLLRRLTYGPRRTSQPAGR
ncbi:DUF418 domain-containing protein [Pseudonocardia sp. DSM 110487]|uniref:DUF418 domain-containing protein n=1 Tax=Pseudonocardia sp. DSM 110487 TaxID=2865833 RepID=UPI001C69CACB|nr:DUF418 domain-containing protein [Pseudonocardia sp. DSM 110487]QYN33406.1 DUF418 domain-containing protein [Pseudonocardia sp. DSM 110487]